MNAASVLKRACTTAFVAFGCVFAAADARAADPQPYTVDFAGTGDAALDSTLRSSSLLDSLRAKAPVGPFALVIRARQDVARLDTVLQSFGYYQGRIDIQIDGQAIRDPDLIRRLAATPNGTSVAVKIAVAKGPLFHLRRIAIDGDMPSDAQAKLGLASGQPAVAADVLAAAARLHAALEEDGYALAKVDTPLATEDAQAQSIDVTFKVERGRRATIGPILFSGLQDMDEAFVRGRLLLHEGDLYQPSKIEAARQDLAGLGVFSSVTAQPGDAITPAGAIPVIFTFQERPKHVIGLTGAYSTDLGGSVKTTWSDRNLLGEAEQLNFSAAGTGIGGTDTSGLGYDLTGQFIKPDFLQRDQSLEFDVAALKQDLQAYDQTALTAGPSLNRKLSPDWTAAVGLSGEEERIEQEGVLRIYTLAGLPLTLKYDSTGVTDVLKDPISGVRAAATATPTLSFGDHTQPFVIAQLSGSTYFDLARMGISDTGRSVVAVRGLVGSIQGASQFALPPDQRFYGGGSATVRGFKYQSIGPLFADDNPIGGTAIDAGTVEFRQRLFEDYGAAVFVDAGQVDAGSAPFVGTLRIGTGAGLRYYTPIGVIRLDVAVPVNRPPGGDTFEFYLGVGQAF